ncbi:MAG: hypothetical protein WAR57_04240 [Candidatus Phosphoribacter sp.]
MQLRVAPEDLVVASLRMRDDGPLLRSLGEVLARTGARGGWAACDHPSLAAALVALGNCAGAALGTLADATDTLATGLGDAGQHYAEAEDRLAVMGRRVIT